MGRRVKVPIVAKKKRQREQLMNTQEYKYGTLVEQLDSKRWRFQSYNTSKQDDDILLFHDIIRMAHAFDSTTPFDIDISLLEILDLDRRCVLNFITIKLLY